MILQLNQSNKLNVMKNLFSVAAVAASFMIMSCNKANVPVPEEGLSDEKVELHVGLEGMPRGTKTTSTAGEAKINSLQVFLFRTDGDLDAYGKAESGSVKVSTTTGMKDIFALVNAPDMSGVTKKAELLASVSELSANSLTNFEMAGDISKEISASVSVTVPVKRIVGRVGIDRITNRFSAPAYQDAEFIVKRIYLVNVAGDINYGLTEAPAKWYNKVEYKAELPTLTADEQINKSIAYNEGMTGSHYYYCYPNPTSRDTNGGDWTPRYTRLVVETTLDGKTYYYPIDIPGIERNKTYTVTNLTITRPGSLDPDIPVTSYECTFGVEVQDWDTGFSKEDQI